MANESTTTLTTATTPAAFMRVFEWMNSLWRFAGAILWPFVDLLTRLWLAQTFFVSGVLKLTHWQSALNLAATEYPVSWMNPVTAAYTGVSIELIAPILLATGFATRYGAFAMLLLSLVIQLNYQALDSQLIWVALFGWFSIYGAGPISIDGLIRRGIADSALPLAPRILKVSAWIRDHVTAYYLSVMRVWFGVALLAASLPSMQTFSINASTRLWLPVELASHFPAAAIAGALLLAGIATRYVSIVLMLTGLVGVMTSPTVTVDTFVWSLLAILALRGAGKISIDYLFGTSIDASLQISSAKAAATIEQWPHVVIVGAGFGGLSCAVALESARVRITLIDRGNYHLFQPLLYQVATAGLSPGDIAAQIRPLFKESLNTRVLLGTVGGVDTASKEVMLSDKRLPYDYLVLATGAAHSYFGKDQWAPYAPGLKRIEDATEIRRKLLTAFEHAEATDDDEERKSLLTFLIVGGGPTGVELAGAIAELAHFGMEKEFRRFDPASARVILVQSAPRLLPAFPEKLAAIAQKSLQKLGVEVLLGSRVENIDAAGVTVSGSRISSRTVLWAAGVMASPAAAWLKAAADNAGRIKVDADLSVPGFSGIYSIGDTSLSAAWKGQPVPGLAPAAKQGGAYVAQVIRAHVDGRTAPASFSYKHLGSLATIGRKAAVADFGFIKLWGAPAWWLWGVVHVGFLVGLRNRMSTMINWFWAYLTFGGGIRLITGGDMQVQPQVRREAV